MIPENADPIEDDAIEPEDDTSSFTHPRHHHGCCHRDQQPRNLGHQRITHCQQNVTIGSFAGRQPVLRHTNGKTANDVDDQNQNTSNSVTTHKLASTVHGAKKAGFFLHFHATAFGFCLIDQACIQIGIDGHLLTRHGIQGETCRHLSNTLRTFGNHHKVDHHQDGKHDQTHSKIATNQKVTKGLDHCTGSARASVTFQQHHTRGGHIQRQTHQRTEQQH